MTTTANAENLWHYKRRFPLIVEQILAFSANCNLVTEVKNFSQNFKQIAYRCFMLQIILIQIGRSILLQNFNQFRQKSRSELIQIISSYNETWNLLFFPVTLVLFWKVIDKIFMMFLSKDSYMVKIFKLFIIMGRIVIS